MDFFFNDLPSLERNSVLCFLVASDLSQSERFQLWRKLIKPTMLNCFLPSLEIDLRNMGIIWFPQFRCRLCSGILKWIENYNDTENDHPISSILFAFLDCTECYRCSPIMKCNIVKAMDFFTETLTLKNSQLLISALHLLMISAYWLNSISPPSLDLVEDPFHILRIIYNKNPNELKYGGGKSKNSILLVDVYECDKYPEYPILYFCDTITVPCRFYFYPLKFKSNQYNPPPKNLSCYRSRKRKHPDCLYEGETKFNLYENSLKHKYNEGIYIPKYQEDYLIEELTEIGNMCIKPGSDVVLGQSIKKYVSKENLKNIKNIKVLVPDSEIRIREIVKPAENICKLCLKIAFLKDATFNESNANVPENSDNRNYSVNKTMISDKKYNLLSIHLISAVLLLLFANTPFETILFHIVCLGVYDKI